MLNTLKTMILAGGLTLATVPAHAAHFGVFVGPVYRPWGYGPSWGYGPYGGYGPGPYAGRIYVTPSHPHQGQVKFDTKEKDAQVFVDGAYAGTVKDVNAAWLPEGTHALELRTPEGKALDEQVFVVAGKTVHVNPSLMTPAIVTAHNGGAHQAPEGSLFSRKLGKAAFS